MVGLPVDIGNSIDATPARLIRHAGRLVTLFDAVAAGDARSELKLEIFRRAQALREHAKLEVTDAQSARRALAKLRS
jgi:hypothetical protein